MTAEHKNPVCRQQCFTFRADVADAYLVIYRQQCHVDGLVESSQHVKAVKAVLSFDMAVLVQRHSRLSLQFRMSKKSKGSTSGLTAEAKINAVLVNNPPAQRHALGRRDRDGVAHFDYG